MGSILDKTLCPIESNFLSCPKSPLKVAKGQTVQQMVTQYFALLKDYQVKDILMNMDESTILALIGLPNKISTQVF